MNYSRPLVFLLLIFSLCVSMRALALSPEEEVRVDAMLHLLSEQKGLVFIRNGTEHSVTDAVSHLRLKLDKTRSRIKSAEEFIDKVGSSSSMSGKPYLVRKPGEEARPAGPFLHELLKQTGK